MGEDDIVPLVLSSLTPSSGPPSTASSPVLSTIVTLLDYCSKPPSLWSPPPATGILLAPESDQGPPPLRAAPSPPHFYCTPSKSQSSSQSTGPCKIWSLFLRRLHPTPLPLSPLTPGTLVSLLFLEHIGHGPTSGSMYLLFLYRKDLPPNLPPIPTCGLYSNVSQTFSGCPI